MVVLLCPEGPSRPEGTTSTLCTSAGGHRLEDMATRHDFRLMFPEAHTLREPAAGGALLDSRRDGNVHFPARSPHPLAARSVGLSRAPAPSVDELANQPIDVWHVSRDFDPVKRFFCG